MLAEIWERLRGYDKWVSADATVESSDMQRTTYTDRDGNVSYTYDSSDVIVWSDAQGGKHEAYFTVPDDSSLYQLVGDERIVIRYNPANPDEFYLRELLQTRVHTVVTRAVAILFCVGFLALCGWLRLSKRR